MKKSNTSEDYLLKQRKELGEKIKAKRIEVKLSQKQLGELIGLTYSTIGKIENGLYNFGVDYFTKLGIVLNFKVTLT